MAIDKNKCSTCGTDLIQRSRIRLFFTGVVFIAIGVIVTYLNLKFWPFAVFTFLIAAYLIVWSTSGKGRWCRQCKKFPFN